MNLFFRYFGFFAVSFLLPIAVLVPWNDTSGVLNLLVRLMILPSYCCVIVFILIGFRPPHLRRALQATPNQIDDLHLWLAPLFTIAGFLWAGFHLVGVLAIEEFSDHYPLIYLCLFFSAIALAIWIGVRVFSALRSD